MNKGILVLVAMLAIIGFAWAAVQSNQAGEVVFLAAPVTLTETQALPATIYKTNSYTTVYSVTNNTATEITGFGNIEVLSGGLAFDDTGLTVEIYEATPYYDGTVNTVTYPTVESWIDAGAATTIPTNFTPSTGIYTIDVTLPGGATGYAAVRYTFGIDMPSANYAFNAWISD